MLSDRKGCPFSIIYTTGIGAAIGIAMGTFFRMRSFARPRMKQNRRRLNFGLHSPIPKFLGYITGSRKFSAKFARWTFLFSCWSCAVAELRGRKDFLTPMIAGGLVNITRYLIPLLGRRKNVKRVIKFKKRRGRGKPPKSRWAFRKKFPKLKRVRRRFVKGFIFMGAIEALSYVFSFFYDNDEEDLELENYMYWPEFTGDEDEDETDQMNEEAQEHGFWEDFLDEDEPYPYGEILHLYNSLHLERSGDIPLHNYQYPEHDPDKVVEH